MPLFTHTHTQKNSIECGSKPPTESFPAGRDTDQMNIKKPTKYSRVLANLAAFQAYWTYKHTNISMPMSFLGNRRVRQEWRVKPIIQKSTLCVLVKIFKTKRTKKKTRTHTKRRDLNIVFHLQSHEAVKRRRNKPNIWQSSCFCTFFFSKYTLPFTPDHWRPKTSRQVSVENRSQATLMKRQPPFQQAISNDTRFK